MEKWGGFHKSSIRPSHRRQRPTTGTTSRSEMQPHTFCEEVETFLKTFASYTTLRNFGIGEVSPSQRNDASQAETGPSAAIPNIFARNAPDPPPRNLSSTEWLHDRRWEVRFFSERYLLEHDVVGTTMSDSIYIESPRPTTSVLYSSHQQMLVDQHLRILA